MKKLSTFFLIIIAISTNCSAAENLFCPEGRNHYEAIKPKDKRLFGAIHIKANNEITFDYGNDGSIRLNGTYRIEEKITEGNVQSKKFVARLFDNENTTIWVDSAILEFDMTEIKNDDLESSKGAKVNILIWLDGCKKPTRSEVILKRS